MRWLGGEIGNLREALGFFDRKHFEKQKEMFELDPYDSLRVHVKTCEGYIVRDHFQTPPDPQKGCKGLNVTPESLENIFRLRACLTFANTCWRECISDTWTLSNALLKK